MWFGLIIKSFLLAVIFWPLSGVFNVGKTALVYAERNNIIPGVKPRYGSSLDIEKYLKKGESKPRWQNVGLPSMLDNSDVSRYRIIFRIQSRGDWKLADRIIYTIKDPILIGHVLAQRYLHPTKYRTSYRELAAWLSKYGDHPEARRIYKLALKRRPRNFKFPNKPVYNIKSAKGMIGGKKISRTLYRKGLSRTQRREVLSYIRLIKRYSKKGWTLAVKKLVEKKRLKILFTQLQLDRARTRLAAGYFASGRDKWAFEWAKKAIKRSGKFLPEANWTAGLAAWRLGMFETSMKKFEAVMNSDHVSAWLASAGAFWASRASIKLKKPELYSRFLEIAANYPRTFYGFLACHILGKNVQYNWKSPPLFKGSVAKIANEPGGKRAISLIQIGKDRLAERGLRRIFSNSNPELTKAMLAIADRADMPAFAMRLGKFLSSSGSATYDSTTYPVPHLILKKKEIVDRELILAIIRQESGFNPKARSPRGASGLMQLMPGTASYVAKDRRFRGSKRKTLFDPEVNLRLGQRYIGMLLREKQIAGNLFHLVAAWNGGPGNLSKWLQTVKFKGDPLLFIESIPSKETRIYIERVVANYWMYQKRFSKELKTLDHLVSGKWPMYKSKYSSSLAMASE